MQKLFLTSPFLFRLNIPPFVPARGVLESLGADDLFENKKPLKDVATKVKQQSCAFFFKLKKYSACYFRQYFLCSSHISPESEKERSEARGR